MASAAQIAANRVNAQLSTGPRTLEGKARSSRNRLTHGLCGPHTVLPGEDAEEYQFLIDSLMAEHEPAGPTGTLLIAQMAQAQWKLNRIARIEANLLSHNQTEPDESPRTSAAQPASPSPDSCLLTTVSSLLRYESAAHRAFDRALANLQKLKSARTAPPSAAAIDAAANQHLLNLAFAPSRLFGDPKTFEMAPEASGFDESAVPAAGVLEPSDEDDPAALFRACLARAIAAEDRNRQFEANFGGRPSPAVAPPFSEVAEFGASLPHTLPNHDEE